MLIKSEIFMSLNSKQTSLCQLANTVFCPKETKENVTEGEWQKRVYV